MKAYLRLWLIATALLLLLVAGFTLVVDPYGIFRLVDAPGFNSVKPQAGNHGAMVKAYQVTRVKPRALILGNSRAEVGFDPEHRAWPESARPVFNLALPGTGTAASLRYLRHSLADLSDADRPPPGIVVWGIDLMDFLVDETKPRPGRSTNQQDRRLLTLPDGSRNPGRLFQRVKDYGEATLTLGALLDSLETLRAQGDPHARNLTPLGFNPMCDYFRIAANEGYWALFRQRDIENLRAYLRRPKSLHDATGPSSAALDDFREVLDLCRRNNIALKLVIYPYHARLLEILRIAGHLPVFEAWQRELVHILREEARRSGGAPFPLWDFSGFHEYSMEAVPPKGDRSSAMRWYWEAGHFKRELGDVILERLFDTGNSMVGFGVRLTSENLEDQFALRRQGYQEYTRRSPEDVQELEEFASNRGHGRVPSVARGD
jgi:hypothetical protein